ncbi:hypothetical protein BEWA_037060 [Theileria equi strain WA]|uniref:Signal peptide containing protein n=1 Tax=Theileria equi strain WA TaxID=1537102 RepID=L1LEJ1_THEEQ|nr:hypothetical protein BEWA_037060 [Theileria equi strain WA]EKX73670.1 hypothetical protein BEWA_037060 [Theileria equi strain WA]|eukprot:XP_004833122.1 hypothetical protein BEWA_037060 [Theileria equi strain WA]
MKILVILCVAYVLRLCSCESLDDIIARFDGEVAKTQKLLEDAQSTLKGAENALEEYTKACTEIQSSKGKEVEDARKAFETAQKTLGKVSGSDAVLQALKKALEDLDKGAKFEPPSVESQGKVVKEALEKVADIHDLLNTVKPLEKLDEGNHEQQSSGTTPVDAKPKVVEHTTVSTSDPVEKSPTEENVSEQDTPKDTEKTSNSAPEESRESVSNEPNETQSEEVTLQKPVEESKTPIEEDVTTTDEAKSEDLKPEKESHSLGSPELRGSRTSISSRRQNRRDSTASTISTTSTASTLSLDQTSGSATLKLTKPDDSIYQSFEYYHDDNHIKLVLPQEDVTVTKLLESRSTIWTGKAGETLEYAKVYLNKDGKPGFVRVWKRDSSGVTCMNYTTGRVYGWSEFKDDISTKINSLKVATEHKGDFVIDLQKDEDTKKCRIFSVNFLGVPTRSYSPKPGYYATEVMDGDESLWKASESTNERCLSCDVYTKDEQRILSITKKKNDKTDDAFFEFSDGEWKSMTEDEFHRKFQAMVDGPSQESTDSLDTRKVENESLPSDEAEDTDSTVTSNDPVNVGKLEQDNTQLEDHTGDESAPRRTEQGDPNLPETPVEEVQPEVAPPAESPEDVQPEKGPEEESGDVGPSESEPVTSQEEEPGEFDQAFPETKVEESNLVPVLTEFQDGEDASENKVEGGTPDDEEESGESQPKEVDKEEPDQQSGDNAAGPVADPQESGDIHYESSPSTAAEPSPTEDTEQTTVSSSDPVDQQTTEVSELQESEPLQSTGSHLHPDEEPEVTPSETSATETLDLSHHDDSQIDLKKGNVSGLDYNIYSPKKNVKITSVVDAGKELWTVSEKDKFLFASVSSREDSSLLLIAPKISNDLCFEKTVNGWTSIKKEEYKSKLEDLKSGVNNQPTGESKKHLQGTSPKDTPKPVQPVEQPKVVPQDSAHKGVVHVDQQENKPETTPEGRQEQKPATNLQGGVSARARWEATGAPTGQPKEPTSIADFKSKVDSTLFNLEEAEEDNVKVLNLKAKLDTKVTKLTYGEDKVWEDRWSPFSSAILYLDGEKPTLAVIKTKDSVIYRYHNGKKWKNGREGTHKTRLKKLKEKYEPVDKPV